MRLSAREIEVARLVAEDLLDREIANIMQINVRTVHEYLDRIAAKIGAAGPHRRRHIRRWVEGAESESRKHVTDAA